MSEYKICWLSIDPVRRKIDFYPKSIATRIEKYYQEREIYTTSKCPLNSDFFNATIHFHSTGSCYQTTPGISMGRAGFKQPGYRSVKRCIIDPNSDRVIVLSKQVHGEWRIAKNEDEAEIQFNELVPYDLCLYVDSIDDISYKINTWSSDDLTSGSWDIDVIIWQWCRGTVEEQGDLFTLPDNWYIPYNSENTNDIEMAFQENRSVKIDLPIIGERNIVFIEGTCYAKQISLDGKCVRFMRRVIKTVQQLKVMLDRISNITLDTVDINKLLVNLPENSIPHHFNCPIMQDIMKDPVRTVDNHVYDRHAIERWFTHNTTSPLTGLRLTSTLLVPDTQLKKQIHEFLEKLLIDK